METAKPKLRLHMDDALRAGSACTLTAEQAHRATTVMRLRDGAALVVFNGRDGEWRARLRIGGKRDVTAVAEAQLRAPRPEPGPWLLFAPVKKAALDMIVEKAVELGAERLWPTMTDHTVVGRVNLTRLRAQALEAAEQCERLTVPEVAEPAPLSALAEGWPAERPLVILSERGAAPLAEAVHRLAKGPPPAFLVGPEGGFAVSELDALAALPFGLSAALGPRILRAETAALACLTCWQVLAGDWSQPPPPRDR